MCYGGLARFALRGDYSPSSPHWRYPRLTRNTAALCDQIRQKLPHAMTRQEVAPLHCQQYQLCRRFEIVHRQEVNTRTHRQIARELPRTAGMPSLKDVRRYLPGSLDWLARMALLEG